MKRRTTRQRTQQEPALKKAPNQAPPVEFLTETQELLYNTIRSETVTFAVGPAGTGKTHIAVWCGLDYLMRRKVSKLVLTRPIVEAGEKMGFLPGTLKDKIDPYLRPLYDAMEEIAGKAQVEKWLQEGAIEVAPLAFMRGRTFKNSFVILDEAQNATAAQLKMVLTRIGAGSKMVIDGDPAQSDITNHVSAFMQMAEILPSVKGIDTVAFGLRDSVRHPIIEDILEALGES